MTEMKNVGSFRYAVAAGLMGVALLAGCKSKVDQTVDQAKAQAASTGVAQQVQYVDANGDTFGAMSVSERPFHSTKPSDACVPTSYGSMLGNNRCAIFSPYACGSSAVP